jgi:hypothetical protein
MAKNPLLAGAIHDLQARLGSIRIAVTAVAGLDLDEETRREMLNSASDESVRASAELAGVSALATCLLDDSTAEECDVHAAVVAAADNARLAGLDIEVTGSTAVTANVRRARLEAALPALLRIAGGAGKSVRATIENTGIVLEGDDPEPLPPIAGYLVGEVGASITITFGERP